MVLKGTVKEEIMNYKSVLERVFENLAKKGRLYQSENELVFNVAYELMKNKELSLNVSEVRFEYVLTDFKDKTTTFPLEEIFDGKSLYFDMVINHNGKLIPIEFKYLRSELDYYDYHIRPSSASDAFNYVKDIRKIELFKKVRGKEFAKGYAIILSNFENIFNPSSKHLNSRANCYDKFQLTQGHVLSNDRIYLKREAEEYFNVHGTHQGLVMRPASDASKYVKLLGNYRINWNEYQHNNEVEDKDSKRKKDAMVFKYMVVEIV